MDSLVETGDGFVLEPARHSNKDDSTTNSR